MDKLRFSALAILVAVGIVACGGGETAVTTDDAAGAATDAGTAGTPEATSTTATPAEHVYHEQIAALLDDPDVFLLDVRNPDELPEQGAIEGYTLIPIDELAGRLDELPKDKKILTI